MGTVRGAKLTWGKGKDRDTKQEPYSQYINSDMLRYVATSGKFLRPNADAKSDLQPSAYVLAD